MGAWGTGCFENDTALDWLGDYDEDPAGAVDAALGRAAGLDPEDIDADLGCEALAAAEAVALAFGRPDHAMPSDLRSRLTAGAPALTVLPAIKDRAKAALDRVAAETSELAELWEDGAPADLAAWRAGLAALRARLA